MCVWHQPNMLIWWVQKHLCTFKHVYVAVSLCVLKQEATKKPKLWFLLVAASSVLNFSGWSSCQRSKRTNECERAKRTNEQRAKCTSSSGLSFCLIKRKTMSFVVNGMRIEAEFNYYCCCCFSASSVVFAVAHKYHFTFTFRSPSKSVIIVSRVSISIEYPFALSLSLTNEWSAHIHFHTLRALKPTSALQNNQQKYRQKRDRKNNKNGDNDETEKNNCHGDEKDTRSTQRKHGITFIRYVTK